MSVQTTADNNLDLAQECIGKAEEALREIVVGGCHGHDEYCDDWTQSIRIFYRQLVKMKMEFLQYGGT